MGTLAMKLSAPMQSWGLEGRFNERTTNPYPTKSGVIGLLAAALGYSREDDITEIATWKVAVRVDVPGKVGRDFQTARTRRYDTQSTHWLPTGDPYVSRRYYLMGATFVVAVEMPDEKLPQVAYALNHPAFPLFLGRRSCPPATHILMGEYPGESPMEVLAHIPWAGSLQDHHHLRMHGDVQKDGKIRLQVMRDEGDPVADATLPHESAHDYPVSFSSSHRQFLWRMVVHDSVVVDSPYLVSDPMSAIMEADAKGGAE